MNTFLLLSCLNWQLLANVTEKQVVAAVIVREAGGEGVIGMKAVASVIENRARVQRKSPYEIVMARYQFSCLNSVTIHHADIDNFVSNSSNHPAFNAAMNLSEKVRNNTLKDVTGGATYYHEQSIEQPAWVVNLKFTKKIGNHLFYKK